MAEVKVKDVKKAGSKGSGGGERKGAKRVRPPQDGVEQLRKAADRKVGQNSEELADLLLDQALGGKLECAKVLVGLAEKKKRKEPEKKRDRRSLAELLASEPEWEEDNPQVGDVWNGTRWVRPEGGGEAANR